MTIQYYKTILETAALATSAETFVFGYSWDVNIKHKDSYPVFRAYPEKWSNVRADKFVIKQEFWIYNIDANKDNVASWDTMIAIWEDFKTKLTGNVRANAVADSIDLYQMGQTVENGQAIKIVTDLTIWC